ncbi:MAG: permease-like cell division protein FtsX [Clostridia bacterium]|nr:permease-like cell division protein FtsX [Clostridia bacterium]
MKMYSIPYFFGQTFKGLWRNKLMALASVIVLFSCLVLMGSFVLLLYNVNVNIDSVVQLNEIVVIVDYKATDEEVQEISDSISKLGNIAEVTFISKEEGLESERSRYEEYSYLFNELTEDNPLPDVFTIRYKDNSEVPNLIYQLKQIPGVSKVNNRIDIANDIENIKNGISFVFIWFLAILFVVSIFVIINTIKLGVEMRNKEISAMRYIGATNFFITTPFVIEGAVIGLIASILAFIAERYLYEFVYSAIHENYSIITVIPFSQVSLVLGIAFLCVGVLAGVVGCRISLRRYMKI